MGERWFVAVGGLVASGKSTVAGAIARRIEAERIEADDIRHELLDRPSEILHEARWVEAARLIALEAGARFLFVECRVPRAVAIERLSARDRAAGRSGWAELHAKLAAHYEPLDELAPSEATSVDCQHDVEAVLQALEVRGLPPAPVGVAPPLVQIRPTPSAVTFDCWNTLLVEEDWPLAHALRVTALHDVAEQAGVETTWEAAGSAFDAAWGRHQELWTAGVASGSREIARWGLDILGVPASEQSFESLVHLFEEASHTSHVKALDGARELLGALVAADIPCGLVCDTGLTPGRQVRRLLHRAGLLKALTTQIFSDEIGVPKPDGLTFTAALEPLGVAPEHAVHVGDLRRTDVAGARAVGMRSVRIRDRYDDAGEDDADFVVTSHTELRKAFGL